MNECLTKGCSHVCFNLPGGSFCACPSGFTLGSDGLTCIGKEHPLVDTDHATLVEMCSFFLMQTTTSVAVLTTARTCVSTLRVHTSAGARKEKFWPLTDDPVMVTCYVCSNFSYTYTCTCTCTYTQRVWSLKFEFIFFRFE